jgi:hypothetical protein
MSTPTFEERYTAWIDGRLAGEELAAFERELESAGREAAEADREDVQRLGKLLRRHAAPTMPRADAFNAALLERIGREGETEREPAAIPVNETPARGSHWNRSKLAWAAAIALLAALAVIKVPRGDQWTTANVAPPPIGARQQVAAEIVNASTSDADISVTPITSEQDGFTVLWLDGLDYLPASYQLQ